LKIGINFFFHFFSAQTQTEHNIYAAMSMSSFMLQHFVLLYHGIWVALKLQTGMLSMGHCIHRYHVVKR